ncbi:MAG: LysR family transcriptional regulator [Sphingomonadales bacterium]|nr:LysR family transcriptional regulator [Sphingomonadales bacterium]
MKLGDPTLDQLRIFIAVADHGSFGGAAKAQGRAVSAVSYGIAQLEAQLGLSLFDREGSRRPVLTAAVTLPSLKEEQKATRCRQAARAGFKTLTGMGGIAAGKAHSDAAAAGP